MCGGTQQGSRGGLPGGGGLSFWSECRSSLIPLSLGEGGHNGEPDVEWVPLSRALRKSLVPGAGIISYQTKTKHITGCSKVQGDVLKVSKSDRCITHIRVLHRPRLVIKMCHVLMAQDAIVLIEKQIQQFYPFTGLYCET